MKPRRIDAVLIRLSNAQQLVAFYRDVIGLPLKDESHNGAELHWGCFLDGVHFAIHESRFPPGQLCSRFSLSFEVDDVDQVISELRAQQIPVHMEPHDRPFGRLAAVTDPDGNLVYLHKY